MNHQNDKTILIVNDSPDQLEMMQFMFQQAGYHVLTASSGNRAFEIVRQSELDLVLSDVMMPDGNGIELCRSIRADEKFATLPILLVSALRKDVQSVVEALEVGADDYIEIPVDPLHLITRAARLLERKSAEDVLRERESYYRALIENVSDIVTILSTDGVILYESPSIEQVLGFQPNELVGQNGFGLIHPDDRERVLEHFMRAVENFGTTPPIEYRFQDRAGGWRILESIGKVIDHPSGKVVAVINSRDVTERKHSEQLLLESEERFKAQYKGVPIPTFTWRKLGDDFVLTDYNDAAEKITRGNIGKVLSVNARDWFADVPEIVDEFHRCFNEKRTVQRELPYRFRATNEEKYLDATCVFVPPDTVMVHTRDITEQKQIEARLQANEARLQKQNKVLTELTKRNTLFRGDFQTVIREITEISARTLDVERVSIWLYADGKAKLRAIDLYELGADRHSEGAELLEAGYPSYFAALGKESAIVAKNARQDPRTQEFADSYLVPLGITSMLDAPIRMGGTTIGVVCNEQIGTFREWELDEQNFAGSIADLVSLILETSERQQAESALRHSQQMYEQLVNSVEGIVWEADAETFRFTFVSQYAERLLGYPLESWLSEPDFWSRHLHPDDREQAVKFCVDAVAKREDHAFDYRMIAADGREIWLRDIVTIAPAGTDAVRLRGVMVDITERKLAEEALRRAEASYRKLVESLPAIVYLARPTPPYSIIYISPNITNLGDSAKDWRSLPDIWNQLLPGEDRAQIIRETEAALGRGENAELEYHLMAADGTAHWFHDKGHFVTDESGNKIGWQGVIVDVTETKKLEEQLRQSQKLESVGRLAGGIAHDFNNMLTAINGYCELILRRMTDDDPIRRNIEEIRKAGQRSTSLTHQLLAFSRQQVLQPKVFDLNEIITDTINLLQRLIGEDILLNTVLDPRLGLLEADPGQLTQVIMNLAVNARDAMPKGGNLTIRTENVYLDDGFTKRHPTTRTGSYILLSVSDTGTGLDSETQQHIFEPFYTTKEVGKGTGLGLATVYGIVSQSGGYISVESELGAGTTFYIYLPRIKEEIKTIEESGGTAQIQSGTEVILIVEDEDLVRQLTCQILEECGYEVIEARNGVEALAICRELDGKIDLLLTDIVMHQMGGRELAEKLTAVYPELRILFMSGYTNDAAILHDVIETDIKFIQKPFTFDSLAQKVRECLDTPK
jgi:PAS domain S-box-containing protein